VDLGPDVSRRIGKTPLIARDIITIPQPGAHVGDIASVVWCRSSAAARSSILAGVAAIPATSAAACSPPGAAQPQPTPARPDWARGPRSPTGPLGRLPGPGPSSCRPGTVRPWPNRSSGGIPGRDE
jgi:hypothetical protein